MYIIYLAKISQLISSVDFFVLFSLLSYFVKRNSSLTTNPVYCTLSMIYCKDIFKIDRQLPLPNIVM